MQSLPNMGISITAGNNADQVQFTTYPTNMASSIFKPKAPLELYQDSILRWVCCCLLLFVCGVVVSSRFVLFFVVSSLPSKYIVNLHRSVNLLHIYETFFMDYSFFLFLFLCFFLQHSWHGPSCNKRACLNGCSGRELFLKWLFSLSLPWKYILITINILHIYIFFLFFFWTHRYMSTWLLCTKSS